MAGILYIKILNCIITTKGFRQQLTLHVVYRLCLGGLWLMVLLFCVVMMWIIKTAPAWQLDGSQQPVVQVVFMETEGLIHKIKSKFATQRVTVLFF